MSRGLGQALERQGDPLRPEEAGDGGRPQQLARRSRADTAATPLGEQMREKRRRHVSWNWPMTPPSDPNPALFREVQSLRVRVRGLEDENENLKRPLAYVWMEVEHLPAQALGPKPVRGGTTSRTSRRQARMARARHGRRFNYFSSIKLIGIGARPATASARPAGLWAGRMPRRPIPTATAASACAMTTDPWDCKASGHPRRHSEDRLSGGERTACSCWLLPTTCRRRLHTPACCCT